MEDDLNLDLSELDKIEQSAGNTLKAKDRFKELSIQVIEEKKRNEELAKAKEEADKKAADLAKENEFLSEFSGLSAEFPGSSEYQDKIKEKVRGGYSTKDAIISVLHTEGKLNTMPPEVIQPIGAVEGGSASINLSSGEKELNDMSREEKRAALVELDKQGQLEPLLRPQR